MQHSTQIDNNNNFLEIEKKLNNLKLSSLEDIPKLDVLICQYCIYKYIKITELNVHDLHQNQAEKNKIMEMHDFFTKQKTLSRNIEILMWHHLINKSKRERLLYKQTFCRFWLINKMSNAAIPCLQDIWKHTNDVDRLNNLQKNLKIFICNNWNDILSILMPLSHDNSKNHLLTNSLTTDDTSITSEQSTQLMPTSSQTTNEEIDFHKNFTQSLHQELDQNSIYISSNAWWEYIPPSEPLPPKEELKQYLL